MGAQPYFLPSIVPDNLEPKGLAGATHCCESLGGQASTFPRANPALGHVPGSAGCPHVVLCGSAQQDDSPGMLFLSRCCRLATNFVGLLSAARLQADVLSLSWGAEASGSCLFWCCGPAVLPEDIWGGLSLSHSWQQLLEQAGSSCQTSPLPWFS